MQQTRALAAVCWAFLSLVASAAAQDGALLFPWAARAAPEPGSVLGKHGRVLRRHKAHVSLLQEDSGAADSAQTNDGESSAEDLAATHEHYRLKSDVDSLRDRLDSMNGNAANLRERVQAQTAALKALHLQAASSGDAAAEARQLTQALVWYLKVFGAAALAMGLVAGTWTYLQRRPASFRPCCHRRSCDDAIVQKMGQKANADKAPADAGGSNDHEVISSVASTPQIPEKEVQASLADWARLVTVAASKKEVPGFGVDTREKQASERQQAEQPRQPEPQPESQPPPPMADPGAPERPAAPKPTLAASAHVETAIMLAEPQQPSQLPQRIRSVAPPERIQEPLPSPKPPQMRPEARSPTPSPALPQFRGGPATPPPRSTSQEDSVVKTPPVQTVIAHMPDVEKEVVAGIARPPKETPKECQYFSMVDGVQHESVLATAGAADPKLQAEEEKWWGVQDEQNVFTPEEWSV